MFDPRTLLPDDLVYEIPCGVVLLVLVLVILFAYVRKRAKWDGYIDKYGDKVVGDDRTAYLKRMRGLVGRTMLSAIVFIIVLFFGLLISIAFVETFLGKWTWLLLVVFIIGILVMQTYMILSLHKFKDLPEDEYGYVHDIVKEVSGNFNLKPAALKLDENPDINAYTTSVFGRSSVLVITKGLLDRVESGAFEQDQLQAIVGHELGHIVNNDATITTLLNPIMMFVLVVKGVLEIIVRGILFVIIRSGQFGVKGVLRFIIAIVLILALIWILLYVGIAYVVFYITATIIVLAGMWVSRQKEYAADLFGSLVMGSRLPLGLGLMNLNREVGVLIVQHTLAAEIIKDKSEKMAEEKEAQSPKGETTPEKGDEKVGQAAAPPVDLLTKEEKLEIVNSIDAREAIEKDPTLVEKIPMRDIRALLEEKGFEPFDEEDFVKFADFDYSFQELAGEFMMDHPLTGRRAHSLDGVKSIVESRNPVDVSTD